MITGIQFTSAIAGIHISGSGGGVLGGMSVSSGGTET